MVRLKKINKNNYKLKVMKILFNNSHKISNNNKFFKNKQRIK